MTHNFTCKRIITHHIPQLIALRLEFLISLKGEQPQQKIDVLTRHLQQYFSKAIPTEALVGWMAWEGDMAVGVGAMAVREQPGHFHWPDGRLAYVHNMYTMPTYRKQGICSEILQQMIAYGKEHGLSRLELHASAEGEPVYRKYDFKEYTEPFLMLRFK